MYICHFSQRRSRFIFTGLFGDCILPGNRVILIYMYADRHQKLFRILQFFVSLVIPPRSRLIVAFESLFGILSDSIHFLETILRL